MTNKPKDKYICLTGHDADGKPLTEEQIRSLHKFVNQPVTSNVKELIEELIAEIERIQRQFRLKSPTDAARQMQGETIGRAKMLAIKAIASLEQGVVKENLTVDFDPEELVKVRSELADAVGKTLQDNFKILKACLFLEKIANQSQLDQPDHIGEANEKVSNKCFVCGDDGKVPGPDGKEIDCPNCKPAGVVLSEKEKLYIIRNLITEHAGKIYKSIIAKLGGGQ